MTNENMHALLEARLTAAAAAEHRITALAAQAVDVAAQMTEASAELRNQVAAAQLVMLRIHEVPPHRRSTDVPRPSGESLTWPAINDPLEQLP